METKIFKGRVNNDGGDLILYEGVGKVTILKKCLDVCFLNCVYQGMSVWLC